MTFLLEELRDFMKDGRVSVSWVKGEAARVSGVLDRVSRVIDLVARQVDRVSGVIDRVARRMDRVIRIIDRVWLNESFITISQPNVLSIIEGKGFPLSLRL